MRLINVRRGQFVYYENRLHKVYSVKPFFRQSVHLIRLSDLEQVIVTAREIDLYRPQHLDSFVYNNQRFTLNKHEKANVGDYILVINPRPDSLDRHHLHAIEIVSSIEEKGVISNKLNGIKHTEYWVMVEGLADDATKIDWQNPDLKVEEDELIDRLLEETYYPKVGNVYQKNDSDPLLHVMVVAIEGQTVYLGNGMKVTITELNDSDKWSLIVNPLDQ
ncbi:MAG TPA: hypothetical protein VK079_05285 [Bacillota bacterium]|nr:hypothetical protein [Bacillota bacterium]